MILSKRGLVNPRAYTQSQRVGGGGVCSRLWRGLLMGPLGVALMEACMIANLAAILDFSKN